MAIMTPEERRSLLHETRESIRHCQRTCGGCSRVQSAEKLDDIELLPDDAHWMCEHCGRDHCIA